MSARCAANASGLVEAAQTGTSPEPKNPPPHTITHAMPDQAPSHSSRRSKLNRSR